MKNWQPHSLKFDKIDILSQSIAIISALIAVPAKAEVLEIDFKLANIAQGSSINDELFAGPNLPQLNSPQPTTLLSEPLTGTQASSVQNQDQDTKQRIVVKGRKTHWERAKPFEISYQALSIIDAVKKHMYRKESPIREAAFSRTNFGSKNSHRCCSFLRCKVVEREAS
jgi:hypothetical protein